MNGQEAFSLLRNRFGSSLLLSIITMLITFRAAPALGAEPVDLNRATLVVRSGNSVPLPERTAARVLLEEVKKRTDISLPQSTLWPENGAVIALLSGAEGKFQGKDVPATAHCSKAEGFAIFTDLTRPQQPVVWIVGADARGALFGVGKFLRTVDWQSGILKLDVPLNVISSPDRPIRGHQLGYRATANSYDAWSPAQFEQYIRELALFGSNSVEGIPFQDERPTLSSYPRSKMNVDLSRICERYGQAYWMWVPADFDLRNKYLRAKALLRQDELFQQCPEVTGIFVAGGDPGDNHPKLVIPYVVDLAKVLQRHHPKARIWLSMQGYDLEEQEYVYHWLASEKHPWLGGIAAGPSSPPLAELRSRLPKDMPIRDYPDITHSVRCQFPVPYWDPAFAFTLGRECVNPRPIFYSRVIHDTSPFTDGFISYSDGCHDDVNKVLWSSLAWDSNEDVNTILTDYCRLFFGPSIADTAAAGIFAFERDGEGALATNGGVDATFALWKGLEKQSPQLIGSWRWQTCLLRAYYDIAIRKRLIYESQLESEANEAILGAGTTTNGSAGAIEVALAALKRADTTPVFPEYPARVVQLCEDLNKSIGLQTSVKKYGASGSERGCVLDFLNYPLNNRLWLEDEFTKVAHLKTEAEKVARLREIALWEHPGPGSYYDSIGNVAKSPHEVRNEKIAGPLLDVDNMNLPGVMFWVGTDALSRVRQSWITDEGWPTALKYPAVDPNADYVVRTTGVGDCLLRVNGVRIAPTIDGKKIGDIKEFPVPRLLYRDGQITLTFDPTFEPTLNWRVQSRLTEVWLIKK